MTDLRKAYGSQIAEIFKAAQANVDEATATLAAQDQAVDDSNKSYNNLQAKTDAAQRELKSASSELRSVAKDRSQKTGKAIQARAKIDRYTEYAEQLPGARKAVADANEARNDAEAALNQAKAELAAIRYFV